MIIYKCLSCNKCYWKKLNEELKTKLKNTFKFSNTDINKFILLLRKDIYPYEYMDYLEKVNEEKLPEKEEFYRNLNIEDIIHAGYIHAKRVCKDFDIKNLGEYHDLYLKSDVLLLVDFFENFKKMCLKIDELIPAKFISAPGLAWQATLKKKKRKTELLTDIDILLMAEKGIRSRICHAIDRYAKDNNNIWKTMIKLKNDHILIIGM